MKKLLISAAIGAMLVAGGVAVAQSGAVDGPGPRHALPGDTNTDGKLTKAELTAGLDKKFAELDQNRDGKITPEERAAMRQKRMDERFARMDTDSNGQISKAEFGTAHAGRGPGPGGSKADGNRGERRHAMMAGRGFDADKDGTITRAEFNARPLAMFERADANKDGVVTADEAKAARPDHRRGHGRGGHGGDWSKGGPGGGDMPPPPPAQ